MPRQNPPINKDQINQNYQYDAYDITRILDARRMGVEAVLREAIPTITLPDVRVSGAVNLSVQENQPDHLVQILNKEKTGYGSKTLLIPCNIPSAYVNDNGHWVGIVLKTKLDGSIDRAGYLDSLDTRNTVPSEIQQMFATVYPGEVLHAIPCANQNDHVSSGPYLVESLLKTAFNLEDREVHDELLLRLLDIESLYDYDKIFSNIFFRTKQAGASNSEPQEELLSVPENIADLFTTVTSIQQNIKDLLTTQPSGTAPVSAAALQEQFSAVCDRNGVIKLQLRYVAGNRNLTPFLYRPLWREDKIGFMRDHSKTAVIGVVGLAGSVFKGPGLNAAREAATEGFKIGITNGLKGLATAFNPYGIALTAAGMAGSYVSEAQSRKFAANIVEALALYNASAPSSKDPLLIEAEQKINDEFGFKDDNSRNTYRFVRWFGTSREQYEFAHLVWAQIMAKLKKPEALDKFVQLYEQTSNETFKAMALIGQICMLMDNKIWVNDKGSVNIAPEERKKLLDKHVFTLNSKFPKIVEKYLGMVLQAYFNLNQVVITQEHTKAFNEFDLLDNKLDSILNFKELHCLRYLQLSGGIESAGKIAEVVFTFAQALCHIIKEEHFKVNNTKGDKNISAKQKDESIAAQEKLQECTKLITSFGLWHLMESERSSNLKCILEDIDKHTKQYLSKNFISASEETKQEESTATKTPMFNAFKHGNSGKAEASDALHGNSATHASSLVMQ